MDAMTTEQKLRQEIAQLKAVIAALQSSLAIQDKQLAAVQGQMRRSALPFKRDQTARA